ncbi:MAG: hypothetical protein ABIQ86_07620 [Steroidobacteraceae bacterium]
MIQFSPRRFGRVIQNDALRIMRPVLYTTVALFGLTMLVYLFRAGRVSDQAQGVQHVLFGCYLIGAGLLLTGVAFQDMHHPLDRYQYLMLPVSSFERLMSRFLLTGPLFVLYGTLAFMAFDIVGKQLVMMYWEIRQPPFSPFTAQTKSLVLWYMLAHLVTLTGGICFRTHAFLKTILFLLGLVLALTLVENAAERMFFPDLFSWTQFENITPLPLELMPRFAVSWMNVAFVVGLCGWMFYVAYVCLRDHEASDGV